MKPKGFSLSMRQSIVSVVIICALSSCAFFQGTTGSVDELGYIDQNSYEYKIGPGDTLDIFVWRNPEVSSSDIPVRPDGRISAPLVDSLVASGKTPTQLADEIEVILSEYIKEPLVTVTVKRITGDFTQQVRVVGEAANPSALPYSRDMTVLDVMIAVGGLTEFADGNKASLVRTFNDEKKSINVRLDDLLRSGEVEANMSVLPGDILVIPEAWF